LSALRKPRTSDLEELSMNSSLRQELQRLPHGALVEQAAPANRVTGRAVLIGVLSIAFFSIINPYLSFVVRSWDVGSGQLMNGPVVALFVLVVLNTLLVRLWPGRAFSRAELLVVYGMMTVSLGLLEQGGLPYVVALVTYPFFAATPGNQFQDLIWPHIPAWFRTATPESTDWLWEGMPRGATIPWAAWTTPWLAWGAFTFALMGAMYCLAALLSRDWIQRQRLTFPLVEVPLAITGESERPVLGTSLMRSRAFWAGFALPAAFATIGWLHRFVPSFPAPGLCIIDIGKPFAGMELPWSALWDTHLSLVWSVIGVMCLLPTEVVLSLWLFYVLYKMQLLGWASLGLSQGGGSASVDPQSFVSYEEAGAYIALSLLLLYESRHFIKRAWLALARRARDEDVGSYAPLSARWAVLGLIACVTFMTWFGICSGMAWWSFVLLFGVFFTVLLGSSRLVSAAGVLYPDTGRYGYSFLLKMLGSTAFPAPSLVVHTYFAFIYMQDPMNVAMPQMMNSFKLTDTARIRGRQWTGAAAVAILAVIVTGVSGLLYMLYHKGASQLAQWPFYTWAHWAFEDLSGTLHSPQSPDSYLRLAVGIGAIVMTALVLLHGHLIWWPVSPIGFVIASTYTSDCYLWSNALIAWLVTSRIKRYGGLRLYRAFRPAFIGLVLGDYLTSGLFTVLNTILDCRRMAAG
jgi:hypothetical protein